MVSLNKAYISCQSKTYQNIEKVGHIKSIETFGLYGHDIQNEIKRVANAFDDILNF
jgi:hypothetical protein